MKTVQTRLDFLAAVAKMLPPNPIGVELGVLNGDFSQQILDVLKPKYLTLIDPYETGGERYDSGLSSAYSTETEYQRVLDRFKNEIANEQIAIIREYSFDAVYSFADNSLSFVYLDASHLEDDVKKDLTDWLPKMKEGSLICGHDLVAISNFGVIQAVNWFCEKYKFKMVVLNSNGGDWALQKA